MPGPRSGTQDRQGEGRFVAIFPARVNAVVRPRQEFAEWLLEEVQAGERMSAELGVVFSELATNAAEAAVDTALEVVARAWLEGSRVVLEMINASARMRGPALRWDLEDPLRSGGRGLQLVHAFVDGISIDQDPDGRVIVRCERSLE